MNWVLRKTTKAEQALSDPAWNRFRWFPWLAGILLIFGLLYSSSYIALAWLPPYEGMDMKSQLTADYGPWEYLEFQPLDPAILQEVQQERDLPDTLVINGGESSTPVAEETQVQVTSTPQPTIGTSPANSTDSPPASTEIPMTSFTQVSIPTGTTVHTQPTTTPRPTQGGKPTKTRKPPRNQKTPKPPKTPSN